MESVCDAISEKASPQLKKAIVKLKNDLKEEKIFHQLEIDIH